jgi:hypothetical protein
MPYVAQISALRQASNAGFQSVVLKLGDFS